MCQDWAMGVGIPPSPLIAPSAYPLINLGILVFIGLKMAADIRIGAVVMGIATLAGERVEGITTLHCIPLAIKKVRWARVC
jgi:hypothetical protein